MEADISSMNQLLVILFILFSFGFSSAAELCADQNKSFNKLTELTQNSCVETLKSQACQDLFKKMRENGEKPEEKALQCSDKGSLARTFETSWNYISGCRAGGWNFVKDTFVSIGTAIGEGVAQIVLDVEAEAAVTAACEKDPQGKLNLFKQYNEGLPKLLQVEPPSAEILGRTKCGVVKNILKMQIMDKSNQESMRIMRKSLNDAGSLTDAEKEVVAWNESQAQRSDFDLVDAAKAKLKEMGVQLECYNQKEAAAMVCEAIAEVATLAGGPAAAALKAAKVKNIAKIAGVGVDAQKAATASRAVATAADLEKAAKFSNAERIAAAETSLGRALSEAEKKALISAHEVGTGTGRGYGSYSASDLSEKSKLMREAGFSSQERDLLMRQGIAGSLSDTKVARDFATKTRLEAERLGAKGDTAGATTSYRKASDSYDVYINDVKAEKTARDYWVGAKMNAGAERYDKAADLFIKTEMKTTKTDAKAQNIFDALSREKDELRVIAAKNPASKSAQKAYQDHRKLIEAVVNNPQLKMGDAWKSQLLKP